jgi:hypothetical protein
MKAFPSTADVLKYKSLDGMDLRDYFAAHAPDMPSWFERKVLSKQGIMETVKDGQKWFQPHTYTENELVLDWIIRWRYEYADAMMKARVRE